MEVSNQRHALAALIPDKGPPVPVGQESRASLDTLQDKFFCLFRRTNLDRPVVDLVTDFEAVKDREGQRPTQTPVQWVPDVL
jgi:hypothetical protein